jgi:hypothetical protein
VRHAGASESVTDLAIEQGFVDRTVGGLPTRSPLHSLIIEHILVVLQKRLDGDSLLLNVAELALDIHGSHDCWREHDGDVERGHLRFVSRGEV